MKHAVPAAIFAFGATIAAAQAPAPATPLPDIPKPNCEKPEWPGRLATRNQQQNFDRVFKEYGACTKAYIDERQAAARAHQTASQAAVDEYNAVVTLINKEREAASNR
jgi:hypothetical protein